MRPASGGRAPGSSRSLPASRDGIDVQRRVGVDRDADKIFVRAQCIVVAELPFEHGEIGFRGIVAAGAASLHALAQHGGVGMTVQDRERHAFAVCQAAKRVALARPQERGIDDHRVAGIEHGRGRFTQARIGAPRRCRGIDVMRHRRRRVERVQAEKPLALDVRTQANRSRNLQHSLRHMAFARSRQAVGDEQARITRRGQPPRCADIIRPGAGQTLGAAQPRHQRPHQRPIDGVVAQHSHAGMVAGGFEPAVEKAPRQVAASVRGQVHGQEGDVALHVDPAQAGVELDAVERRDPIAEGDQVVQVQIAMAFAHPAPALAGHEACSKTPTLRRAPVVQVGHRAGADLRLQPPQDFRRGGKNRRRSAVGRLACGCGRGGVKCGQPRRQPINGGGGETPGRQPLAQERTRGELLHTQRVFDGLAVAAQAWSRRTAIDRHYVQVDRGGESAVQPQFFLAAMAPRLECTEVEKTETNGFLDFPGKLAIEQHPGDMRLDAPHRSAGGCLQHLLQAVDQRGGWARRHGHGALIRLVCQATRAGPAARRPKRDPNHRSCPA